MRSQRETEKEGRGGKREEVTEGGMDAEDLSSGSRADTLLLEVMGQRAEGTPPPGP